MVSLFFMAGCQKEEEREGVRIEDGFGALRLELLEMQTDIPVIQTKGSFGLEPTAFPIRIDMYESGVYKEQVSFESYSAMIDAGMPLVLPVGDFRVTATSYDKEAADGRVSEMSYFEGGHEFMIEEKTVTSVPELVCKFKSVGVELALSEQFKKKIEAEPLNYSYAVKVGNGTASWTFGPTEHTKPAYFLDACDELLVKVSVKLDGLEYPERTYRIRNDATGKVAIGEYYLITLDAGEEEEAPQLQTQCIGGGKYGL